MFTEHADFFLLQPCTKHLSALYFTVVRAMSIVILAALAASSATAGKRDAPQKPAAEKPAAGITQEAGPKIVHAAIGAKVWASSTSKGTDGESGAAALIDGDLSTRWSSEYSAPQRITIELKKEVAIDKIRLHWEAAYATKYHILVSDDGEGWTPAHFFFRMGKKKDVRVDTCDMKHVKAKYIMVELTERVNDEWGFSLYEIEVLADPEQATP